METLKFFFFIHNGIVKQQETLKTLQIIMSFLLMKQSMS